jgi:hypothetical protein
MKESWQNLIDLVVNPRATFERLKSSPKWVVTFVVFCLFSLILGWAHAPYTQKILQQNAANQFEFNQSISLVSLIISALIIAVLWDIILSPILTIVARVFKIDSGLKFGHIYAGMVHTSVIRTLVFLVDVGVLPLFKSVADVQKIIDIRIIPGLHLLVGSSENTFLLIFLSYVNLLSVWYIVIIAIAIATLADVKRTTAYFASIIIFLIRIVAETLFIIVHLPN